MGLPAPSPEQEASLQALKDIAQIGADAGPGKVAAIQVAIDKQQDVEDYQKLVFDSVNDDIVRKYELERKFLDGQDIDEPIVEVDVQDFASGDTTGRLWNDGDFSPKRIDEFDGIPLVVDSELANETEFFTEQDVILDILQNGVIDILLTNGVNNQALTASSTDGEVESDVGGELVDDDIIVINNASDSAIIKVTNVVEAGAGPFQYTFDISEYIVKPNATIGIGADAGIEQFGGFDNTERTNKTATDLFFQTAMDSLLAELNTEFDNRKIALNNEKTELQANADDNLDPTAETNVDTSISAINGFLGGTPPSTINISDIGITAINNEKTTRLAQITQRIINIALAIAFGESGTSSYYDVRFNTAEGRCRLNNGSIVLLNDLETAKASIGGGTVEAQGLADRYDALLP